jgi:hypothetical protein
MTTTTTKTLAVPTIHLNGTSRENLMEDLLGAYHALTEAITALGRACPNGRDYYPQGNDALSAALEDHRSRLARLESVKAELMQVAEAIGS